MVEFPTVSAKGVSTQRHVDALYSASKHYSADQLRKATISTGITVEYVIHTNQDATEPANVNLQEERVVLIMGFATTKEAWAPLVDMLLAKWNVSKKQKNLKILSFDNRGVGNTDATWWRYTTSQMAQDTLALLDYMGWDDAHIVGISMGGMISLELATAAPKRVRSLTLMVTTRGKYQPDPRSKVPMHNMIFSKDPAVIAQCSLELMYSPPFLAQHMTDTGEKLRDVMQAYHIYRAKTRKSGSIVGLFGQFMAVKTHYVSNERLRAIQNTGFPILIVGSMMDILIPPTETLTLRKHMDADHVHTLFFEHGGHGVALQYAEEVADGVMRTFAQVSL